MNAALRIALATILVGCGGSSTGAPTPPATGSVSTPEDAGAFPLRSLFATLAPRGQGGGQLLSIVFSSHDAPTCADAESAPLSYADTTMITASVWSDVAPLASGTFIEGGTGLVVLKATGLGCADAGVHPGSLLSPGSITITSLSADRVAGSFEVAFAESGASYSGTFDVPVCTVSAAEAASPPACGL